MSTSGTSSEALLGPRAFARGVLGIRRRLERFEAFLGLVVLGFPVIVLCTAMFITALLLFAEARNAQEYLIAIGATIAFVPLIVLEYLAVQIYYRVYSQAVHPVSLAIALTQMEGSRLLRQARGAWWLLHAVVVLVGVRWGLTEVSFVAVWPDPTLLEWLVELTVKASIATGAVYACNTLVLCTIACWTCSPRVLVAVWRVRLLLDTTIGLLLGFTVTLDLW